MTKTILAVTQMSCGVDLRANEDKAEGLVREAAAQGAQIILLQELFQGPYFCKRQDHEYFALAGVGNLDNPLLKRFSRLAAELSVVLPVSFFERAGKAYYNSMAMMDADGTMLGLYRKTHIPQGPGYEEKYYFNPGDTGFKVWRTIYGNVGVGICWDQWYPECARSMALMDADVLLYPTAIGSEPTMPDCDSMPHWRRTQQGQAAANVVPVCTSNRIGTETDRDVTLTFYGSSFITDPTGELLVDADRTTEGVFCCELDLEAIRNFRAGWGFFRDRRPQHYGTVMTLDGVTPVKG